MSFLPRVLPVALAAAVLLLAPLAALAQSNEAKPGDKPPQAGQTGDSAKESQRRADEFAEAAAQVSGPAGNPECVWLGRRVVNLLWRDDLDTAFRHLDLYDRFGCPGQHIQATFRCVVKRHHRPEGARKSERQGPCLLVEFSVAAPAGDVRIKPGPRRRNDNEVRPSGAWVH